MVAVSLTLSLMFSAVTLATVVANCDPQKQTTINYYQVTGDSSQEIRANLDQSPDRPADPNDKTRSIDALSKYTFSSSCDPATGQYVVSMNATITLPKAVSSTNSKAQRAWDTYASFLIKHEMEHVKNGATVCNYVAKQIQQLDGTGNSCKVSEQDRGKLFDEIQPEADKLDQKPNGLDGTPDYNGENCVVRFTTSEKLGRKVQIDDHGNCNHACFGAGCRNTQDLANYCSGGSTEDACSKPDTRCRVSSL